MFSRTLFSPTLLFSLALLHTEIESGEERVWKKRECGRREGAGEQECKREQEDRKQKKLTAWLTESQHWKGEGPPSHPTL
jgi:hypothetical protein